MNELDIIKEIGMLLKFAREAPSDECDLYLNDAKDLAYQISDNLIKNSSLAMIRDFHIGH